MNLTDYAQFGVAIFSIAALAYVISKFLKFMEIQERNFKDTIDNHLEAQRKANNELTAAIRELLDFLKWQNRNNRK
jgi:hypothetical protein